MMKKKGYQKPTVEIDELVVRTALLQVSGGYAKRTGYESTESQNWDDEESNQSHIWNDEEE